MDLGSLRPLHYLLAVGAFLLMALLYIWERNVAVELQRKSFQLRESMAESENRIALLEVQSTQLADRVHIVEFAKNELGMVQAKAGEIEYILYVPPTIEERQKGPRRAIHYAGFSLPDLRW